MNTIPIQTASGQSRIMIGQGFDDLITLLPTQRAVVIADDTVYRLYGQRFPDLPILRLMSGEGIKTLETIQELARGLADLQADRSWFVLGIGGGIVCDLAGFVASTYMRGVRFGFVPTTLLAQVDASVGGKNGVNLDGYKNMLGVFSQPEFVLCDPEVLQTLSEEDFRSGLAEVVKHAAIADAELFQFMERNTAAILGRDQEILKHLVLRSVHIKAGVVTEDERETGLRRILNFGHTIAHALEKVTGTAHGRAVSMGMVAAARLSVHQGFLPAQEARRLQSLLQALCLPTEMDVQADELVAALGRDKKRSGDDLHYVFLQSLGQAFVQSLPLAQLEPVLLT